MWFQPTWNEQVLEMLREQAKNGGRPTGTCLTKRLRGLHAADVEKAFQASEYSRESLIKIRSVLGKALDYGLRRKLVTTNIARHVELPADARRTEPGRAPPAADTGTHTNSAIHPGARRQGGVCV